MKELKRIAKFYTTSKYRSMLNNFKVSEGQATMTDLESYVVLKNIALPNGQYSTKTLELVDGNPDFPEIDLSRQGHAACPDQEILTKDLERILPFCSKDETRIFLNAVCFSNKEMVATDGHTLLTAPLNTGLEDNYLIHRGALKGLLLVLKTFKVESFTLKFYPGQALVTHEKFTVALRELQRDYPRWKAAIPAKKGEKFTIDRGLVDQVTQLLKDDFRALGHREIKIVTINADHGRIMLKFKGRKDFIIGTCDETLKIGPFGLNFDYLLKVMKGAKHFATFFYLDKRAPIKFEYGEIMGIIMPVKL